MYKYSETSRKLIFRESARQRTICIYYILYVKAGGNRCGAIVRRRFLPIGWPGRGASVLSPRLRRGYIPYVSDDTINILYDENDLPSTR